MGGLVAARPLGTEAEAEVQLARLELEARVLELPVLERQTLRPIER